MSFQDKVVWVTGASSGIGRAVALEFSKQGAKLILSSRNEETLKEVRKACKKPDDVFVLPLDLEDYLNFDEKAKTACEAFGQLDILFNNGGVSQRSLALDTDIAVDKRIMDINYFGTIALTKAVLPYMIEKKTGQIVTITSITGKVATPARTAYAASKHALHGFFDSLRSEVYEHNIGVTLVCPGYIQTNLSYNALTGDGTKQNKGDAALEKGIAPEVLAQKLMKGIAARKNEIIIGGLKETASVYLKRFAPNLLVRLVRDINKED